MAKICFKKGVFEIEVEADKMPEAEEIFVKIVTGLASGFGDSPEGSLCKSLRDSFQTEV